MEEREGQAKNFIPFGSAEMLMRKIIATQLSDGELSETQAQKLLSRLKGVPGELAEVEGALRHWLLVGMSEEFPDSRKEIK